MRTHLRTPSTWISLIALVFAMSGGAVAASLITSKQIKDGSLRVKDFKESERGKLRGKRGPAGLAGPAGGTGTDGAAGARGPSAFEMLPSGETLSGGGVLYASAGSNAYDYAPIPAELPAPLNELGPGRNLFFAPGTANAVPGSTSASCSGTFSAPTAPAGRLCVYVTLQNNVAADQLSIYGGANATADPADSRGFHLFAVGTGSGAIQVHYVWAYKAP